MEREERRGKRCLESKVFGAGLESKVFGKVFGAWISCWKRQVLATARLQRREGQLRASRSCCFGVRHGARKIARATLACSFSSESASSAEMAPCHSGLACSKIGAKHGRYKVDLR